MKQLTVFTISFLYLIVVSFAAVAQTAPKSNDVNTPLHLLQPDYPVQYGVPVKDSVKKVLDRIYNYLDAVTPAQLVNRKTNEAVTDYAKADSNTIFKPGDFRLMSYEWGVTYSGMLLVAAATGDKKFADYFAKELLALKPMQTDGLITLSALGIHVSPAGRLLIRNICMVFDKYMAQKQQQQFSKVI